MTNKPLIDKSGEVRELTAKDIRAMKSAGEVLPPELLNILPKRMRGERGPQKTPKKVSVTVRYSSEVVEYFKATGEGWQTRMNKVLKKYVKNKKNHRAA
jgi:uncharacterized protein (DUF4415 family)